MTSSSGSARTNVSLGLALCRGNKITNAAENALVGSPDEVAAQVRARFHPDDRLMLWFDFFDHDSDRVIRGMRTFQERVVPLL